MPTGWKPRSKSSWHWHETSTPTGRAPTYATALDELDPMARALRPLDRRFDVRIGPGAAWASISPTVRRQVLHVLVINALDHGAGQVAPPPDRPPEAG